MSRPVCVVTGAGRKRVGASVARHAAGLGYDIALHYRSSESEAQGVAEELKTSGTDVALFKADLSIEDEVKELVSQVTKRYPHIDLLVNCASTWLEKKLIHTNAEDIVSAFSSNVLATFLISKLIGLTMVSQPSGGHIVTIGDWATERPYLNHAAYLTAKGCIPTLTRVLAVELATLNPNVRVNCIAPGPVMVPDSISEEDREHIKSSTLVARLGTPEHIAQAVFALTQNTFIVGQVLHVDGGRSIFANGL